VLRPPLSSQDIDINALIADLLPPPLPSTAAQHASQNAPMLPPSPNNTACCVLIDFKKIKIVLKVVFCRHDTKSDNWVCHVDTLADTLLHNVGDMSDFISVILDFWPTFQNPTFPAKSFPMI
jgi:hypothetical protein